MNLESQRHLFNIPDEVAYFNCSYNSPLLNESVNRLNKGVMSKSHPWERTANDFFDDAETIRKLASSIFGGNSSSYAVVPSATYGLSTASRIVEKHLNKGDEILVLEDAFPSIVLPLKRVALEKNADLLTVETPQDGDWTNAIKNKLSGNVKVMALSHCHWTNGALIDLKEIRKLCNDMECMLIIDATQSLGAVPFNVGEIQPDFLVAAGYKWLLCPYGFGLLYVDEKWHNERPLEETWIAREGAENFSNLVNYSDTYMAGAKRFEMSEKCIPTILPGAIAALEQIKLWGVDNIAKSLSSINGKIAEYLTSLGFTIPKELYRSPHMFGATLPDNYQGNLISELRKGNIYVSQRGNSIRFSPHLFIDEKDVDRLLDHISTLINN